MNSALHDTLSVTKRLKESGMAESQAEAVAATTHGSNVGAIIGRPYGFRRALRRPFNGIIRERSFCLTPALGES